MALHDARLRAGSATSRWEPTKTQRAVWRYTACLTSDQGIPQSDSLLLTFRQTRKDLYPLGLLSGRLSPSGFAARINPNLQSRQVYKQTYAHVRDNPETGAQDSHRH